MLATASVLDVVSSSATRRLRMSPRTASDRLPRLRRRRSWSKRDRRPFSMARLIRSRSMDVPPYDCPQDFHTGWNARARTRPRPVARSEIRRALFPRSSKVMRKASVLAAALFLAASPLARADSPGRVQGVTRDETGATLSGVTLDVHGLASGIDRSVATREDGAFDVPGLPPGRYRLDFRSPGFATAVRTVDVQPAGSVRVDVTLRIALNADVLVSGKRTFRSITDLDEPVNGLLGLASAGSEGVVSAEELERRPVYRSAEVFEAVPGVVISQHSGEGKANQYYVRGFNIDHGTDLATSVAGVPTNMPTHAHGQGYSDNNFLIPELVSGVQFQKGTYDAREGDFSAAGAINVNYLNVLDRSLVKLEAGQDRFGRALATSSLGVGRGHLLFAGEAFHGDGPWVNPDNFRKWNGVLRYSQGDQQEGFSVTATAYSARWHSTDQVPERAVASGAIDRYGAVDPSDAGRTHRYTLSGEWRTSGRAGLKVAKAYAIDYGLDLFSNFTYFLDDPANGDQFEQKDERTVFGGSVSQRFLGRWFGRDVESVVGVEGRLDRIPTVGLYHTKERAHLATI